jgi:hypothetical protein
LGARSGAFDRGAEGAAFEADKEAAGEELSNCTSIFSALGLIKLKYPTAAAKLACKTKEKLKNLVVLLDELLK